MLAHVNVLCLPCAGASAIMYLRWRRSLPGWLHIVPVELPGRGERLAEPTVEDFDSLIDRLRREQAHHLRGRFALLGHSMGALLAYGLARRLRDDGADLPIALFVAGSAAPSRRDPRRFADRRDEAALLADLRRQGGTPPEVYAHPEMLRMTLDLLGADYRVCESFAPLPAAPLDVPVHVFAGRADEISADRVDAWATETSSTFTLDWFDGGHFFIKSDEAAVLDALAARLAADLAPPATRACDLAD